MQVISLMFQLISTNKNNGVHSGSNLIKTTKQDSLQIFTNAIRATRRAIETEQQLNVVQTNIALLDIYLFC